MRIIRNFIKSLFTAKPVFSPAIATKMPLGAKEMPSMPIKDTCERCYECQRCVSAQQPCEVCYTCEKGYAQEN